MIGTRTGQQVSRFKKHLSHLQPGEKVAIRGPFGWFKIQDDTDPIVMIAGGVGVTPVRAIVKTLESDKSREIIVIHSSNDYHLFGENFANITSQNDKIKLIQTASKDETQKAIKEAVSQFGNRAYYYISGDMPVIKAIKKDLKNRGISKKRMINDPFLGY